MKSPWFTRLAIVCGIAVVFCCSLTLPAEEPASQEETEERQLSDRVSLDVARDRAKVMHKLYAATLEVMHHRYFHGEKAIVPARALEDVFADIQRESKVEARWISVNMRPMSVGHTPKTDFEKQAAKEIGDGKPSYEIVEEGFYRRAGAIPLASDCVSCHAGFFKAPSKSPKFAGLVISIPLSGKKKKSD